MVVVLLSVDVEGVGNGGSGRPPNIVPYKDNKSKTSINGSLYILCLSIIGPLVGKTSHGSEFNFSSISFGVFLIDHHVIKLILLQLVVAYNYILMVFLYFVQ